VTHPILARLRDRDPAVRRDACADAARDPAAVLLAPGLAGALGDPVRAVWRAAAEALVAVAAQDSAAVLAALREVLHGGNGRARQVAALTGARIAPRELRWLPPLAQALASDDATLRWGAARQLVELGRTDGSVLALALETVGGAASPVARRMAAFCVRELGADDPRSAAALVRASRDADVALRRAALSCLAALLDPPHGVEERLGEALAEEPDGACRRIAAAVLGSLAGGDPRFLSEPTRALLARARETDPDPDLRRAAARALEAAAAAPETGPSRSA